MKAPLQDVNQPPVQPGVVGHLINSSGAKVKPQHSGKPYSIHKHYSSNEVGDFDVPRGTVKEQNIQSKVHGHLLENKQ